MHVVLDFDGTVTTKDTVGTVASHAISFHKERHRDLSATWEEIVRRYGADHADFVSIYQPAEPERTTLEAELKFQRSVRPVELKSLDRVLEARLFRSIPQLYLVQAGQDDVRSGRVELREGFGEYVGAMLQDGHEVSILSVNWSASFIRGVIGGDLDVAILANETTDDGDILGPRLPGQPGPAPVMATCDDKLSSLKLVAGTSLEAWEKLVYVGDSGTDLECLVAAARGVIMSDSPGSKLLCTLRRVGFSVPHVSQRANDGSPSLAWARNFREIMDAEATTGSGSGP